jgi:hypothetical protein
MIYQNRQKNLVSSYLKNIDNQQQIRGISGQQKVISSSRNQPLVAPSGTKKSQMSRNTMGGTIDGDHMAAVNKSLVGNRFY